MSGIHRCARSCGLALLAGLPRPHQPRRRHRERARGARRRKGRGDQGICARSHQKQRRHGISQIAVLPYCVWRRRFRRRPDRPWRCGDHFARLLRGRKDQAWPGICRARFWQKTESNCCSISSLLPDRQFRAAARSAVDPIGSGDSMGFKVSAAGTNAKVPPAVPSLLGGEAGEGLDAHRIQPFYAGLLAKACGVKATVTMDGETVVIIAQ